MGIKNLHTLIRKICPHIYNKVPLSKYAFKKVAVDLSIFMCKYRTAYGNNWLDAFLQMIAVLRYNEIHVVIVYDSKAPPEKDNERKLRCEARARTKERVEKIEESWDRFKSVVQSSNETINMEQVKQNDEPLYLFLSKLQDQQQTPIPFLRIDNEILKMKQSLLHIRSEDFDVTRELFQICGIPIMLAHGEAEATCSALNRLGYVSAVMTDDTDVLAYGTPMMLSKLDFQENTCIEIDYQELLQELQMTTDQFLDLCIMCGTDYNKNIPKIGPDRSYKWIQEYKSIEAIEQAFPKLNYDTLNYKRVRQLFRQELFFESEIPFCDFPDKKKLVEFAFKHNSKYDISHVLHCCFHNQFVEFEDDAENSASEYVENAKILLRS